MKITTFIFGMLLLVLLPGVAHGQCQVYSSANYAVSDSEALSNVTPNFTSAHILTSVVVDGSASMQVQSAGCPDSIYMMMVNNIQNVSHFPSVDNMIGSVGGWSNGPAACASCYISYQDNEDSGPVSIGQVLSFSEGGQVNCSFAGQIFYSLLGLRVEAAYTRSVNTYVLITTYYTPDGKKWNMWKIQPYCTGYTTPPDYSPAAYSVHDPPEGPIDYTDAATVCFRYGSSGWVCLPTPLVIGLAKPQPLGVCTYNP